MAFGVHVNNYDLTTASLWGGKRMRSTALLANRATERGAAVGILVAGYSPSGISSLILVGHAHSQDHKETHASLCSCARHDEKGGIR
jgi:hypothetical protein